MRTVRDHNALELFDRWAFLGEKRRELLRRSWAGVFREQLLEWLPTEQLSSHFSASMGRPTKDLHVAIGCLILQQLHDLTDAQAVEALAFHMTWQYALDLRTESDAYLCERTLRNYRRRVIDNGLDDEIFRCLTDRLLEAFSVDVRRQRLDSTALQSAMRNLTRLGVVVESISKFLRELRRTYPTESGRLGSTWFRRYVERRGEGSFGNCRPTESRQKLPEAGQDLSFLVHEFRGTEVSALSSFTLLERVLEEQFEVSAGDPAPVRVKKPADIPCDNVGNPSDPDSSYNAHRGQGYMAQVMETYTDCEDPSEGPDLITHVSVHKMTVHDSRQLEPALADVTQRGAQPESVLADSLYGPAKNVKRATSIGVELISPAMTAKGRKQGRLTLEDFLLDDDGLITHCPEGHAPIARSQGASRIEARFDMEVCNHCPQATRCPVKATGNPEGRARIQYTRDRIEHRKRRLQQETPAFQSRYRWRAGIEGTISRLKHQMGLGKLRVRGMLAVRYATNLRALGLNIRRCTAFA